mmetsp:Transcript_21688/g.38298  ORF Transcript_21688/g.38298 Transcript_21688/m.38298 type:complete len:1083 (-) Transcript_21688:3-3251(-)
MVRKKVDERIRTLLSNCVRTGHRSLIVVVGDNGKDQVVNLHYLLAKLQVKARPSVLWCYKKELGFSTYRKKRMKQIKKMVQRGLYDADRDDPFELFMSSTNIRWAFYKETEKILGQTYGMCVLQDFEALTPNLLARTIETVEGGGTVVVLLKKLDSLKQLYAMTMDVHARFRSEAHGMVKPRFNERWLLSLSSCETCCVVDDELNILPISKHIRDIEPLEVVEDGIEDWNTSEKQRRKLNDLKESLAGTQPACSLVGLARTVDQAKALLAFLDVVADKSLSSTVTLTAGRGRGKSAALGIAIGSAIAFGYSNIFVTSPSPENLKTVFEFVLKAFDALEYKEHMDYEIVQSTNPDFHKAIVKISVFHTHRQTIQYIQPQDSKALAQAELVVIDEAAAIPLPLVRELMGPYLVFLSSTIHGYEGTGRSLSLKLINQLRQNSASRGPSNWRTNETMFRGKVRKQMAEDAEKGKGKSAAEVASDAISGRTAGGSSSIRNLREIVLQEPIRYSMDDPVEAWLNRTLCLDATDAKPQLKNGTPPPSATELFAVDRDVLFSHHKVSEAMLQQIVGLFVSSHYKNSPNDLLLLSDAPAHRLFVLLGNQPEGADGLPDVLAVIQVALEGGIAKKHVAEQLKQGNRASGDLVPWTVAQQFQDNDFAELDGARVVRIATNSSATRMGYGKRALELLRRFYQGELVNADLAEDEITFENLDSNFAPSSKGIQGEKIKPRKNLPPLLVPLSDLRPPRLHYLSVSYGITKDLFNFWATAGFRPVYLRQTANDLTGEHTCIMLRPLASDLQENWENSFCHDFGRRLLSLLPAAFRGLNATMALSIISHAMNSNDTSLSQDEINAGQESEAANANRASLTAEQLAMYFVPHDIKRLEAYSRNLVDYHMITDLLFRLSELFFQKKLTESLTLSLLQRALLVGMGLQCKTVDQLSAEYDLPPSQLLALFNKAIRKLTSNLSKIQEEGVRAQVDSNPLMRAARKQQDEIRKGKFNSINASMENEQLKEGSKALKSAQADMLKTLNLEKYAVGGSAQEWDTALEKGMKSGVVSVPSGVTPAKDKKRLNAPKERNSSKRHKRK